MNIEELKQKPTAFQLDVGVRQLLADLLRMSEVTSWYNFCELKNGTSDSETVCADFQEYNNLHNNVTVYLEIIAELIDDYVHDYDSFMNTTVPNTFLNGKIVAAREPAVNSIKDLENRVELMDDEYFIADLIGCEVYQGEYIGILSDVFTAGGSDVYVIKREKKNELLLPALASVIKKIDVEQKRIDVEIPRGLLDEV